MSLHYQGRLKLGVLTILTALCFKNRYSNFKFSGSRECTVNEFIL